jgi:hypothetical protein
LTQIRPLLKAGCRSRSVVLSNYCTNDIPPPNPSSQSRRALRPPDSSLVTTTTATKINPTQPGHWRESKSHSIFGYEVPTTLTCFTPSQVSKKSMAAQVLRRSGKNSSSPRFPAADGTQTLFPAERRQLLSAVCGVEVPRGQECMAIPREKELPVYSGTEQRAEGASEPQIKLETASTI